MVREIKNLLLGVAAMAGTAHAAIACTGISLTATDGSYVQARTIEWAYGALKSEYVVIPRGERLRSYTPTGANGLEFTARYGVVGLAVVEKEFIAEGINEAGLSAGLFFFPRYGSYQPYDAAHNARTLADLQVVQWMLTQFATIDEMMAAVGKVDIVGIEKSAVIHWRIGDPSGRQVVMEIVGGKVHFYENKIGVLTNAPRHRVADGQPRELRKPPCWYRPESDVGRSDDRAYRRQFGDVGLAWRFYTSFTLRACRLLL